METHGREEEKIFSKRKISNELISVRDAARWLAAMAAADGLVSPNERQLMKIFAEKFNLDPAYLYRMAHAIANEVPIPEVEAIDYAVKKGRMFEDFVVKLTADDSRFVRINWSSDKFVDSFLLIVSMLLIISANLIKKTDFTIQRSKI